MMHFVSMLAPIASVLFFFAQIAPDASPSQWLSGGGLLILGYLCYALIQRDIKRDESVKELAISLNNLRVHCANKGIDTSDEGEHYGSH